MGDGWPSDVWSGLLQVRERLLAVIPGIFAFLTLLVVGLLLGWLVRAAVSRIGRAIGVDRLFERWGVASSLRRSGIMREPSEVVGHVCFWAIFILFAGWLVANFLSQGVLIAAVNARLPEARLLARGVYWSILLFAVATALTH